MSTAVEVKGLKDLDLMMKQLSGKIYNRVLKGGMRAGQKVLADAAKANLRQNGSIDSGDLEKSIRIRFKRKSERYGWARAYVIAGDKKAFYAHMIEYGTGSYYTGNGTRSGKAPYSIRPKSAGSLFFAGLQREQVTHPGIKPAPFMRPAVDQHTDAALDAFANYLRKRIPKEVLKL
jgi:HK97 gp10 family phage protein